MDNYFATLLAVGGIILFFVLAILIALYVIESLALYTLAKNNGQQDKAVLAWIPFVNQGFYGFFWQESRTSSAQSYRGLF